MILRVALHVKFRAFGFTLGNVVNVWLVPVPSGAGALADEMVRRIQFNERGVKLSVTLMEGPSEESQ